MLGTVIYKKGFDNEQDEIGKKLMVAYKKAYEGYYQACERYDRLLSAYKVLKALKNGGAETASKSRAYSLPYTEKIMRQMVEDAAKEKTVIAGHARECIKYLHSIQYKM